MTWSPIHSDRHRKRAHNLDFVKQRQKNLFVMRTVSSTRYPKGGSFHLKLSGTLLARSRTPPGVKICVRVVQVFRRRGRERERTRPGSRAYRLGATKARGEVRYAIRDAGPRIIDRGGGTSNGLPIKQSNKAPTGNENEAPGRVREFTPPK